MENRALAVKLKIDAGFKRRGITFAIFSGIFYGLYTAFLTLGMSKGIWGNDWYGANMSGLSAFAITYCLAALGSAVNDTMSGIWSLSMYPLKANWETFSAR